MRLELAPSILSFDPGCLRDAVQRLIEAGADRIHFDVMDGRFVPPITFGAGLVASLRDLGSTHFEAHLMTLSPESHFAAFADAGCATIIFHAEATSHSHRLAQSLRKLGVRAGVAINPGTPVDAIEPLLGHIDQALIMTVNPGWGGQEFIPSTLDKVRAVRRLDPGLDVEVDGGIDPGTLPLAKEAGANVIVAGSYVAETPSVAHAIKELRRLCG